ncbi:hypothetical protein [Serpens gallinarum]|jgi:hypothetical protein|uniref:Uncharacterized protein n=1 Tax=Serpens gallinarum TaxID=2763075 RepID=A0ABR8TLG3_9PSED|nr:hypothetical protein [Serpens gallinarum]MBD7976606.1 hypothetical protein [Serpens gallinarum]
MPRCRQLVKASPETQAMRGLRQTHQLNLRIESRVLPKLATADKQETAYARVGIGRFPLINAWQARYLSDTKAIYAKKECRRPFRGDGISALQSLASVSVIA